VELAAEVPQMNVQFLRAGGRRYILGTAKNTLRKFARELLSEDWKQVHEGLEARLVPAPDGEEVFILCRSAERQAKGTGDARTLRETHRRGFTKDRRELRQMSAEIGRRRAARRTAPGTKPTCGTAVRCARGGKCSGVHTTALDEGGELAGVGAPK